MLRQVHTTWELFMQLDFFHLTLSLSRLFDSIFSFKTTSMLAFQIKRLLTNSHQIDCRSFSWEVNDSFTAVALTQNLDCVNRKQWSRMQEIVRSNKISDGQIAQCSPMFHANFCDFFFSSPLNLYKLTVSVWLLELNRSNLELKNSFNLAIT